MRTPSKASAHPDTATETKSPRSATRRNALLGGAAVGAATIIPASAQAASAAPAAAAQPSSRTVTRRAQQDARGSYAVPAKHTGDLPDDRTRHILSRFTGAVTADLLADVDAAGGIDGWFTAQLSPDGISDPAADALWNWFPVLALTPLQKYQRYKNGTEMGWEMMQDLASWIMLRRLISKRAVQEMMVDFWSNLLHVASPAPDNWPWRVDYEEMVRTNALGRFDDLLHDAITHPAMGLYLNNVLSTAGAINENLGRELLECHTVGVDAGYTEKDVVNSARILTGYHVDTSGTWQQTYLPANHWMGRVKVLSFSSPNAKPDGQAVVDKYLTYLSHHTVTATRICTRLAVRFVSDSPSAALVNSLVQVYLDSDTAIVPVLKAMVASDEFLASAMQKVRTPVEDAVATWATLGVVVTQPHDVHDAANQFINVSKGIGQIVYDWGTPDAFPDIGPAWTDSGRILGSMRIHWMAASGFWPNQGISFKQPMDWMPQLPTTFASVVDSVIRSALFLECTPTMLQAACVATDIGINDVITETHPLIKYKFPRLMVSILDTAEHLSR